MGVGSNMDFAACS